MPEAATRLALEGVEMDIKRDVFAALGCVTFLATLASFLLAVRLVKLIDGPGLGFAALAGVATLLCGLAHKQVTSASGQARLVERLKWDDATLEALNDRFLGALPVAIVLGGSLVLALSVTAVFIAWR
ncbi:MAG: hypothetical protein VKS61_07655 [Candidatus Sericytochromatia bacterium]|nr:hypothetical protein [Candidatus Sericytochromatia bacterium]